MPCVCAICGFQKALTDDFTKWPEITGGRIELYPITENGKPDGSIRGFICARCLRSANGMRTHIKSLVRGVRVSQHAVTRFCERQAGERISEESARVTIMRMFSHARRVRFRSPYMIRRFLDHDCKDTHYYYANGYIFVTTAEDPPVILTVEPHGRRKIGRDCFYIDDDD